MSGVTAATLLPRPTGFWILALWERQGHMVASAGSRKTKAHPLTVVTPHRPHNWVILPANRSAASE